MYDVPGGVGVFLHVVEMCVGGAWWYEREQESGEELDWVLLK